MVKAGGISAFVMVALFILAAVMGGSIGGVFQLIGLALFVFTLIALNVNLRGHNFTGASGFIWTILGLLVAIIVISIVAVAVVAGSIAQGGNPGAGAGNPMAMIGALGIWGILIGLIALAWLICFLLLGAKLKTYGTIGGGGIWKGTGIVGIIASALMLGGVVFLILTALTEAGALGFVAGALYIIGALVFLVFWIMLGIGLIQDADRPAGRI